MKGIALRSCLILVENMFIGYQVSLLLKKQGWQTYVSYRDYEAYALILRGEAHAVVADVDAPNLGGLTVLAYCHHHYPSIETYAIIESDNVDSKKLASDMGGCQGYFYRVDGNLWIDDPDRVGPAALASGLAAH